jgi:PAS domain S-box-containing protein
VRNKLAERLPLDGQHFRLLVEGVSDYGIFMLDPEGIVVSWSPAAERIKGYSAEEIIGKHFSCFYPKEEMERGRPEKDLRAARRAGRFEADAIRVRKDGTEFWANVIITALRDDAGHLRGFAEVTRDITRRKRAEAAAEEERRRLETLVESSPVGIVVADTSGRLVLVNRETERITDSAYKQGDTLETLDQGAVRRRTDGTDYGPQGSRLGGPSIKASTSVRSRSGSTSRTAASSPPWWTRYRSEASGVRSWAPLWSSRTSARWRRWRGSATSSWAW